MAIVQISQITQRKGRQADLPNPLAGAELGWSTDTRQLWIGNGTLAEGAPAIGNTEILTEFSDIINLNAIYTYKGDAAGYTVQTGATAANPITQSLQTWMDQYASVKDFGAVGDGITDDTEAINRALNQLYCITPAPGSNLLAGRRALFFPAGTYIVSDQILIPPYARLVGEGKESSVIMMISTSGASYVARTTDSNQATGASIGAVGSTPPGFVSIANMGFESQSLNTSVFLVEGAVNCNFDNVTFWGSITNPTTGGENIAGVSFANTVSLNPANITFTNCLFSNANYGIYNNAQISSIVVSQSSFNNLWRGVNISATAGVTVTGVRVVQNSFDRINNTGVYLDNTVSLCATSNNIFYNVGNNFTTDPQNYIIYFGNTNNVSVGDLFQRTAPQQQLVPCIFLNKISGVNQSIAFTNGTQIQLGSLITQTGNYLLVAAGDTNVFVTSVPSNTNSTIVYNGTTLQGSNNVSRVGTLKVAAPSGNSAEFLEYEDDYVENYITQIRFNAVAVGANIFVTCDNPSNSAFNLNFTSSYFN
jgi:hypothetical protein